MDSANVLCQMAGYDFNCPIDVTMIFEDSDDDSNDNTQSPQKTPKEESVEDGNPNKDVSKQRSESECLKENENAKCKTESKSLEQLIINKKGKDILNFNENSIQKEKPVEDTSNGAKADEKSNGKNGIYQKKDSPNDRFNIPNKNPQAFNACVDQDDNREPVLNEVQMNDQQPVTTFVEDLLKKISEHLLLIMRIFYHYGAKRASNVGNSESREKIFRFIRNHYFELSFNTVETIILPQEHNVTFMNHFLDKTVEIANEKPHNWVCHRGHVRPFFMDLIRWTKQKKDYIKKSEQRPKSNENVILKQHLATPPQAFNFQQTQGTNLQNCNAPPTIQNNLCIFSSGVPGGEISINVNPNILRNATETRNVGEQNGNNNYKSYSPNPDVTQGSTTSPPLYENQYSHVQNNYTTYNRPPPPPYPPKSKSFTQMSQSTQKLKNMRFHHHHYKEQISPTTNRSSQQAARHQNYQSMAQPTQHYQTHYINGSQSSPTENSLNSRLHNNINASTLETQMYSGPVITNVISYAPKSRTPSDRCTMCGKTTSAPYNPPNRPVYCSYLCQELDSQIYNAHMQPTWACTT
uniref:Uncharacterized protein n=1 Tax=Heliothis virescens TaxID=7102 RepID=A0A2A4J8Q1_HELVI